MLADNHMTVKMKIGTIKWPDVSGLMSEYFSNSCPDNPDYAVLQCITKGGKRL